MDDEHETRLQALARRGDRDALSRLVRLSVRRGDVTLLHDAGAETTTLAALTVASGMRLSTRCANAVLLRSLEALRHWHDRQITHGALSLERMHLVAAGRGLQAVLIEAPPGVRSARPNLDLRTLSLLLTRASLGRPEVSAVGMLNLARGTQRAGWVVSAAVLRLARGAYGQTRPGESQLETAAEALAALYGLD